MADNSENVLNHISFIMDGNGRWAKKRLMPREFGHKQGAKKFREIVQYCLHDKGIKYVSVYAFSTENWKRPDGEVKGILNLFVEYMNTCIKENDENKTRVRFLGNRSVFSEEIQAKMAETELVTSKYERTMGICINYGGSDEIVDAVNKLISEGKTHITADDITNNIYTGIMPPPDMIVRTGGEYRLSNYFMWQSAYSELFFTKTLWPDLTKKEVDELIEEYKSRQRNFGGVKNA